MRSSQHTVALTVLIGVVLLAGLAVRNAQAADQPKLVDEGKAATAELVVRGTPVLDVAGPGRGGWPTYTVTVTQVFNTPQDTKVEAGQKLTVKTIKEFNGPVTLYLVFDKEQKLYRLQDPLGERGFSHPHAATAEPAGTKAETGR